MDGTEGKTEGGGKGGLRGRGMIVSFEQFGKDLQSATFPFRLSLQVFSKDTFNSPTMKNI